MISPSTKDGKKSSIPHYPVGVTLLYTHQTTRTRKCSSGKSPAAEFSLLKEDIIYLNIKAFNKFQALTYLHCFQIASTYS